MTLDVMAIRVGARRIWRRAARTCVIIAGAFCVLMAGLLGVLWMQEKMHHPLVETAGGRVTVLQAQLQTRPADEALKNDIRRADAQMRQDFWTRRIRMTRGAWLLLGGAIILVAGIKTMRVLERPIPDQARLQAPDNAGGELRLAQLTVGGMGGAITFLLLLAAWWSLGHPAVPKDQTTVVAAETPVTTGEMLAQWPAFRGWGGAGGRTPDPVVRSWNGATGENILWRTPVTLPGNSSPVIWKDRIILTAATESERQIMAFDLATGKPRWQTAIGGAGPAPETSEDTGHAAPTPVTDGRRAYAIFASGDVGAVDLATGRKVWDKNLGKPASMYGYAASLTLFADGAGTKVIIQWDVGSSEDGKSSLIALDGRTGRQLWQTKRPVGNSWASPLVTRVEADAAPWQVVTAANPWVIGYDPGTGAELWRCSLLGGDVAPSPAAAVVGGKTLVFASQEGINRAAIAVSGSRGEIQPAWKSDDEGLPDIVSPVSDGRHLWTVISAGVLFRFDAQSGTKNWEHEFSASFHATPVIIGMGAARELWLTDATGLTHRVAVDGDFRELGTNPLGENVNASLAFAALGGREYIVIRARKNLYCIGAAPATGPASQAAGEGRTP